MSTIVDYTAKGHADSVAGTIDANLYADQSSIGLAYRDGIRKHNRQLQDMAERIEAAPVPPEPSTPTIKPHRSPAARPVRQPTTGR